MVKFSTKEVKNETSNAFVKTDKTEIRHGKNRAVGHSKENHGIQAMSILLTAKEGFYLTTVYLKKDRPFLNNRSIS